MKNKIVAALLYTQNYDLFVTHEFNRPLHDNPVLESSMKAHGFMPSSPIQCIRIAGGKLKIVRGHHRFSIAKRLGIGVWYVIDDSNTNIFELEPGGQVWTVPDYVAAYAAAGYKDYAFLLKFRRDHGLAWGAAVALVGGESAGSNNKIRTIKTGEFRVGDMTHANQVVSVTDLCGELGVSFASSTAFVVAVSMALRVPEFDHDAFKHRLTMWSANLHKRGRVTEYLDEIEALYNYGAKKTRCPVRFRAIAVSRERHSNFGGNRGGAKNKAADRTAAAA
jgi:hypothetical protein